MSMSSDVYGIKPPDDKWKRMKSCYDGCKNAGVAVPKDVEEFFDHCEPDEAGVVVKLPKGAVKEHSADMINCFDVDLSKIPKDIRYTNRRPIGRLEIWLRQEISLLRHHAAFLARAMS
jgi:hypothetical protein